MNYLVFWSSILNWRSRGKEKAKETVWLTKVFEFIDANYTEDITLHALSTQFNISEGHLSRALKKHLGKNFTEYIRRLRIEKARRQLLQTKLSITDIAMECGFDYVSTFNWREAAMLCQLLEHGWSAACITILFIFNYFENVFRIRTNSGIK